MKYDVDLSIYVPVYNHEKYIVQALDSILMQKTKYSYEVWIGEDASTDNTRAILKEYEKKCPDNFHFLYREENMHNAEPNNLTDLRFRCKGKYLICLEGDDFWTDENKIEKQIDFLESNSDYIAVAHNCVVVGKDSLPNGEEYPQCTDDEYTFKHLASEIMPGQLTTVMMRNYLFNSDFNASAINSSLFPGDRRIFFSLLCYGKIHCMQETLTAYRHITDSGSSFSATYKYDFALTEKWHSTLMEYAYEINNKTAIKYAELLYFRCIGYGLKVNAVKFMEFLSYFRRIHHKVYTVCLYIKGKLNSRLLNKKIWY